MINFLQETIESINEANHKIEDITFIGFDDGEYRCSWNEFTKLADFEYNSGYGSVEINLYLVIEFDNGERFERCEYDGSEWWRLIKIIPKFDNPKQLTNLKED